MLRFFQIKGLNGGSVVQSFTPNLEFVRDMAKQVVASPHFAENPQALINSAEMKPNMGYCGVQNTMFHHNASCTYVYDEHMVFCTYVYDAVTLTKAPA